jgi:hypothetical protein
MSKVTKQSVLGKLLKILDLVNEARHNLTVLGLDGLGNQAPAQAEVEVQVKPRKYLPTPAQQKRIEKQRFSWGIRFKRSKKIDEIRTKDGWARKSGSFRVSDRLFGTRDEARIHAKRYLKIEGHKSFEVYKVSKRPNAWVNQKTGKTNPVIGMGRTNR